IPRHLIVHLPGGSAAKPRALVLNLHGSGGNGAQQQASIGMDPIAEANQFVVAYPDAAIALGGGFAWNVPGQPLLGGGPVPGGGQPYWTYSVPSAQQQWGGHDGCAPTPTSAPAGDTVTLTTYGDCAGGAVVQLYTIDGAGHEWPGAPGQTPAIDASTTMWSFF